MLVQWLNILIDVAQICYCLLAMYWAYCADFKKESGIWMQAGLILFFPLVIPTLLWEFIRGK